MVPLPPALAIMLFPEPYRIPVTVVVVALTLLLTGYISAKLGKAPIKQAMLRNLDSRTLDHACDLLGWAYLPCECVIVSSISLPF